MSVISESCRTSADLKHCLLFHLGYDVDITQLTTGSLECTLRLKKVGDLLFLNIRSNQSLLFFGSVQSKYITLACDEALCRDNSRVQGLSFHRYEVGGYCLDKDEVYYSVSCGSDMYFVFLPSISFQSLCYQLSSNTVLDLLYRTHKRFIGSIRHQHLISTCQQVLDVPPDHSWSNSFSHDAMMFIHDIMLNDYKPSPHVKSCQSDLTRECLRFFSQKGVYTPLTIDDLTKFLFCSKTSLSTQIKRSTGLSPNVFLRCLRLEQVRRALVQSNGTAAIGQIATQYGFASRSHFSLQYQNLFGELPTETLLHSFDC